MKIKLFSVWDQKVGAYRFPFLIQSSGQAIRSFQEAANDPKSEIGKYPADFTLFEHGDFDDETGIFVPLSVNLNLGSANIYVSGKIDLSPVPNIVTE